MTEEEARTWQPSVCFVDEHNRPVENRGERAGQAKLKRVAWG
jgi:aspartate 1-decarboxylase